MDCDKTNKHSDSKLQTLMMNYSFHILLRLNFANFSFSCFMNSKRGLDANEGWMAYLKMKMET